VLAGMGGILLLLRADGAAVPGDGGAGKLVPLAQRGTRLRACHQDRRDFT